MSSLYDSPSAESLEHMRDDKVLQKINDSYVRSLMKMMSSKVLKELRAENETIQKHLNALTKDVHLLAGEVSSVRAEDRSWHQDAMVAKLEALREDVQMSAAREKDFVNELGELRRKVEGRYEDLSAHYRHLDKDVRTSLREFRSEFSEEQQSSVKCLQDFRLSIRDFRSDLDEQRESLKVLQETDLMKHLGDARQVLADLQEERSWHHEAMKKLRESREEQKKSYEEEVSDLDKRSENFRQMLRSALPMELDKRDQSLTKQTEELFEKLQSWTQGQLDAYLDQARLLDQDILDKLNPDFLLMKDQLERLGDTVNQIASQVPALVLGDAQVREECRIFRSDIGKLSDEMVHMGESLRLVLPWVDWLREPGMRNLEERLAALEHLLTEGLNSQGLQGSRFSSFEKELQDQQRCTNELQAVCRKLPEDLELQRRKLLGLEVNLRKYLLNSEELKNLRQDFDSIRVRLKRCEVNQLQEQKNLKICQENCSRYRKACEDIYAKCHQETLQRGDSRNLKEYEDAYAKWRQDAVAWQQEQVRKLQGQK